MTMAIALPLLIDDQPVATCFIAGGDDKNIAFITTLHQIGDGKNIKVVIPSHNIREIFHYLKPIHQ
jgi:hypothetical protein